MPTSTTNGGEFFYPDDRESSHALTVHAWAKSATDQLSQLDTLITSDRVQKDVRTAMRGLVEELERLASQTPIRGSLYERARELAEDIGVLPDFEADQPEGTIDIDTHVALQQLLFDIDTEFPPDEYPKPFR